MNSDKENINNANKLRVEPQKMKRKNNLRKSLAWNSAFFTEEGVLDPLELSLLSGSLGTPSRNRLSVIPEGGGSPELPANTVNEVASAPRRKVVSVNDISQSASKRGGGPQPVALSSHKIKPPDTNEAKVKRKESKVSALLAPKPDPSCVSTSKRSSTASSGRLKRNQIPQPGDSQKNIRLKGASIDTKRTQNEVKPGASGTLITKSTPHHVRRKVSSARKLYSSTNERHSQCNKANNSSPSACAHPLNVYDCNASKIALSFLQNACNNGGNMQYIQPQTAKSSCLRMPSPSLGFFSQSKPSSSLSLLERSQTRKLPGSNIPSLPKVGISNPIHQRPPQLSMNNPQSSNMGCYVASVVSPTSNRNMKFKLELNNNEKLVRASYKSRTYDRLNNGKQLHNIHDDKSLLPGGPCEQLKKDDHDERATDFRLKGKGVTADGSDHPHFSSNVSLHVEVDGVLEKVSMAASDHTEDRQYIPMIKDHSEYSEFQTLCMNNYSDEGNKKVHDQLCSMREFNNQPVKKANLMKLDICQNDPVSNIENCTLRINNGSLFEERSSEELNKCSSSNSPDDSLESQDCRASELEIAYGTSCCNNILYANNEPSGIDTLYGEVPMDGHQLVESGKKNILRASVVVDNLPLMLISDPSEKTAEQAELPVPCLATEQGLNDNCGLHSEFCLLNGNKFSSEEFKEKNATESGNDVISEVNACGGELKNSSVLSSPAKQDCSSDAAKKAECLYVEKLVASLDCDQVKVASTVNDRSLREGPADKCESPVKNFNAFAYLHPGNNANVRGTSILQNDCSTSTMGNIVDVNLFENISFVEMQERDALPHVMGFVLEQGDDCSSKSKCFDVRIQVPPVIKDAGLDVDKKAEHMFMVDKVPHSIEIEPSAENIKCSMDGKNRSDDELIDQASSLKLSPSSNKSGHQTSLLANNCDTMSFYTLNEEPELLVETKESSSQRILQSVEVDLSDSNILPGKAEIKIPHTTSILSSELHDELHVMCPAQDRDAKLSLQKSVNEKKQATCLIKPPPNAVPFSDEWLAALEAAGEEILTMKGGAVQNSPTDKLQPEPGPWSPVRRKNAQGIGPHDCTKFTNTNNQPSTTK